MRRGADLATDFEPVHVGQHQIEDERVEFLPAMQEETGPAGRRDRDGEAGLAEIVLDHLGEPGVVFDEEKAVAHGAILAARPAAPTVP